MSTLINGLVSLYVGVLLGLVYKRKPHIAFSMLATAVLFDLWQIMDRIPK